MVRPNRERELAAVLERLHVALEVPARVVRVDPERLARLVAHSPAAGLEVGSGHERVRLGVASVGVDEERGVEDLERLVRVERRHDLRHGREVPVHELADAASVLDRPLDDELEAGRAERVLDVDQDEANARLVPRRRRQPVLARPGCRLARALLVRHAPDLADRLRPVVRRHIHR